MKYRTLGRTNLEVSEVGIGTWQLAGDKDFWISYDLEESLKALHKYVELGGNFIDTAWVYGYDSDNPKRHGSEELIGKFLRDTRKRDSLIIASKVVPKNWLWPADPNVPFDSVFPSEHIENCVNDSLKSLNIDYIDLMQFHVWDDKWASIDEWKNTIEKITKNGKVKHWGISINDYQPTNCIKTLDTGFIETIQLIFNIFHQDPTRSLLPYAKENNIGLIARVPLDEGGLTGKFTKDSKWPEGDFRSSYFSEDRLIQLSERINNLKTLIGDEANSLTELALRFILSFDEISTVIPGMRKESYVMENTAVSDGRKLSKSLIEEIKKHSWERNFYT